MSQDVNIPGVTLHADQETPWKVGDRIVVAWPEVDGDPLSSRVTPGVVDSINTIHPFDVNGEFPVRGLYDHEPAEGYATFAPELEFYTTPAPAYAGKHTAHTLRLA